MLSFKEFMGESSQVNEVQKFTKENLEKIKASIEKGIDGLVDFDFDTLDMNKREIEADIKKAKDGVMFVVSRLINGHYQN